MYRIWRGNKNILCKNHLTADSCSLRLHPPSMDPPVLSHPSFLLSVQLLPPSPAAGSRWTCPPPLFVTYWALTPPDPSNHALCPPVLLIIFNTWPPPPRPLYFQLSLLCLWEWTDPPPFTIHPRLSVLRYWWTWNILSFSFNFLVSWTIQTSSFEPPSSNTQVKNQFRNNQFCGSCSWWELHAGFCSAQPGPRYHLESAVLWVFRSQLLVKLVRLAIW